MLVITVMIMMMLVIMIMTVMASLAVRVRVFVSALTGRRPGHLAGALLELRDPPPAWETFRHAPQTGCPRCDARHRGGPVFRLFPHHRYVCIRHRYWIGPPDIGHPGPFLDEFPVI